MVCFGHGRERLLCVDDGHNFKKQVVVPYRERKQRKNKQKKQLIDEFFIFHWFNNVCADQSCTTFVLKRGSKGREGLIFFLFTGPLPSIASLSKVPFLTCLSLTNDPHCNNSPPLKIQEITRIFASLI